jgi:hypothetical protein
MDQLLGNLAPLDREAYVGIITQLQGRDLPRYVALFVVTSQAVAIHTGDKIDTVIGKEVAPLAKQLVVCMSGHNGRQAIVIDGQKCKAWCVPFSAAANMVITAADRARRARAS